MASVARRPTALLLGLILGMTAGAPTLADDTEIFNAQLGAQAAALLKPNVLFIVDTSGSMNDPVPNAIPPYDENFDYPGPSSACSKSRVYWSKAGVAPDCDTDQYFELDKLRCEAAIDIEVPSSDTSNITGPLDFPGGLGVYQDRLARFRATEQDWAELSTTVPDPPHVECRVDRGEHGENNADNDQYIVTGSPSPWQATANGETNWSATGEFYTLYSGNYMNYVNNPPTGTPSRISVVRGALKSLIEANHDNINAGLMRFDTKTHCSAYTTITVPISFSPFITIDIVVCASFASGNKGGPVVFPLTSIADTADKQSYINAVNGLVGGGATPLAETLYEAARYYRGEAPLFGTDPPTPNNIQSVASSMDPNTSAPNLEYQSPIVGACQKNFIVYLTDGAPTGDFDADSEINSLLATAAPADPLTLGTCDFNNGDDCLDEVTEFLHTQDHSSALAGKQSIETYMIGFLEGDMNLMNAASNKGGGLFFQANNALQLSNAFTQILTEIQETTSTFSAPSVSVNAFNRITNRKELFFSLFTPTNREHWPGNIKRYELDCVQLASPGNPNRCADGPDADTLPDPPEILDASNPRKLAVDPNTGFFADDARSDWTLNADAPDGANTAVGGAASLMGGTAGDPGAAVPANRKVFTFTGAYTESAPGVFMPQSGSGVLSATANAVAASNAALTDAMLYPGGSPQPGDPARATLIDWAAGRDVNDVDDDGSTVDARPQLGDALHSKPQLVGYGSSAANPDLTLYVATNDGYVHGIDIDTGIEVFSFVPKELLNRLPKLFIDQARSSTRSYGLDGPLTVWFNDDDGDGIDEPEDGNGILEPARGEFVWLFIGQRRGGRRYYALDVTDRAAPVLKWKIDVDTPVAGNPTPSPGDLLTGLGQTWSAPRVIKLKDNGVVKNALVFGGGYDVDQDVAVTPADDDVGNAVFIVDALTGAPIWSTVSGPTPGLPAMSNSIPADVRVFDITGDGLADRIYAGDTRAQLWRFDINNGNGGVSGGTSGIKMVTGTKLAELQKANASSTPNTEAENRRFFNPPDVSLAFPEDRPPFLAITIGSGTRFNPLNLVNQDRLYMIRDNQIGNISDPATYALMPVITENNLLDITTNLSPGLGGASGELFFTDTNNPVNSTVGWMIKLADFSANPSAPGNFVGEKVLAESITFEGKILVTTFTPPTTPLGADCTPNLGDARTYLVNLIDGTPELDLDKSGDEVNLTRADRSLALLRGGIPPEVTILFPPLEEAGPVALVAAEKLPLNLSQSPVKTFWFQQENQ